MMMMMVVSCTKRSIANPYSKRARVWPRHGQSVPKKACHRHHSHRHHPSATYPGYEHAESSLELSVASWCIHLFKETKELNSGIVLSRTWIHWVLLESPCMHSLSAISHSNNHSWSQPQEGRIVCGPFGDRPNRFPTRDPSVFAFRQSFKPTSPGARQAHFLGHPSWQIDAIAKKCKRSPWNFVFPQSRGIEWYYY